MVSICLVLPIWEQIMHRLLHSSQTYTVAPSARLYCLDDIVLQYIHGLSTVAAQPVRADRIKNPATINAVILLNTVFPPFTVLLRSGISFYPPLNILRNTPFSDRLSAGRTKIHFWQEFGTTAGASETRFFKDNFYIHWQFCAAERAVHCVLR